MIKKYKNFTLFDICDDDIKKWNFDNADFVRVYLPSNREFEIKMQNDGFYFADRVIDVSIAVKKTEISQKIRFEIKEINKEYKSEILALALKAFRGDRRFYISPFLDDEIAGVILDDFIDKSGEILACFYKEEIIGFIALEKIADDVLFVRLACVDEKYRISGASMSLYTKALSVAKERGYSKLNGTISTLNWAVANVYSSFGAIFSNPQDIFLKDLRTNA